MRIPRRVLNLTVTALVVLSSSVVLFGGKVSAQSMPLSQTDAVIQQHSQTLTQKSVALNGTEQQVKDLAAKKAALAQQLQENQQAIAALKQQIADKKAAEEAAAKAATVKTVSYSAPVGEVVAGCGDNSYAQFIYQKESGCNTGAKNAGGCLGIGQACPGSKLLAVCPNLDYACENEFFTNYAQKYGGWQGSYEFWLGHGWW